MRRMLRTWFLPFAMLASSAVPSGARTLDPCLEALPPNADLPASHARILFQGDYCDAPACPPGSLVTHTGDFSTQDDLASLGGASRSFHLNGATGARAVLSIDTAGHRVLLAPEGGADVSIWLDYFHAPNPPGMSADFTDSGADAMLFDVASDGWGPGRSASVCLQLRSHQGDPDGAEWIGEVCRDLNADGAVVFPFADYEPQLDFADVDEVWLLLDETGGLRLSLGPIHSVALATPAARMSWGRVKAIYR
jgi:hypothetical protein